MCEYYPYPLHHACMHGDLECAKDLVDHQHYRINERGPDGRCSTPLHLACGHRYTQVVEFLLSKTHCDVNARDSQRSTPLHVACCCRSGRPLDVIKLLLARTDIEVNLQNRYDSTPLQLACARGHSNVVEELVGHRNIESNHMNNKGNTPLHIACDKGNIAVVKVLLSDGRVDQMCKNHDGDTPLHGACAHPHVTELLLGHKHCDVNARNERGDTALHVCSRFPGHQYLSTAKLLLGHTNIKINTQNETGDTPLHNACLNCFPEHANLFLAHPDIQVHVRNNHGCTPLHLAACINDPACAKLLLAHTDIQVNFQNKVGDTVLHLASQNDHPELAKLLLAHPDIQANTQTINGSTPLHIASQLILPKIVTLLLSHADIQVNLKNSRGETPLHLASQSDHPECSKLLLAHPGIQVNAQTRDGSTPLHLISQVNLPEIVAILLAHADIQVNLKNSLGETPLHWASQSNDPACAKLLLAHPSIQVNAQTRDGSTPLHLINLPEIVMLLLARPDIHINQQNIDGNTLLHLTSIVNLPEHAKLLLSHPDIEVNLLNSDGDTPLSLACIHHHPTMVKLLVGHSSTEINFKDREGNTPLHIACKQGDVAIAKILLGAGGADPTCCNLSGQTPLQVATDYEIVQMLLRLCKSKTDYPIDSYVKIFVVGNSEAGKSTLISSLREEVSSLRKILPTQYRRTKVVEIHTAGIIPLQFHSSRFGNVILYDFAGHLEYHSSHSAVLENAITSSTPIFIVVVDVSASPDEITANLHRWLLFIENHSTKAASAPHIVVVGSHIDKLMVKSRGESMEERSAVVIRALGASAASIKHILHDCRDTACAGLDQLYSSLAQSCSVIRDSSQVDIRCHVLYAFILAKFPDNAACRVRDIQAKITEEDYLIPTHIQTLFSLLKTLSAKGQVLLIHSSEGQAAADCFVVLKMAELLHEVNGTLFAPHQFRQHKDFVNSTGLSSRSRIEAVFPLYDPKMIIGYLEQMEFCRRIDDTLTVIHIVHGSCAELLDPSEEHYFFPALIQDDSPPGVWKENDDMKYQFGWCLQCSETNHYLTSRFLHVLLLRLAFSFALAPEPHQQDPTSPVLTRCCSLWKNGIQWLDLAGVETIVEVREHETAVLVMMRCTESALIPFAHLRSSVLKTVLEAKHQLCPRTITREYLVNPSDLQYPPMDTSKTTLYSLPRAAEALLTSQPNTIDRYGKNFTEFNTLLSFEPLNCLGLGKDILRELFDTQHHSDSQLRGFLARPSPQSTHPEMQHPILEKFVLSPQTLNEIFQEAKRSGVRFVQKII